MKRVFTIIISICLIISLMPVTAFADGEGGTMYTVSFDANGGGEGSMSDQSFIYGIPQPLTANSFTRIGYAFIGWNTAQNGTGTSYADMNEYNNPAASPGETITLYAQWEPISYTVTFNGNGGNGSMPAQSFSYDVPQALSANTYTKDGEVFGGWTQIGFGKEYADKQTVINLAMIQGSVIELSAQWTTGSNNVTYYANGHGTAPAAQTGIGDNVLIAEPSAPTETGYNFGGWFKEAECTNKWDFTSDHVATDTDLYASWSTIDYTVKFDANGGSGSMSDQSFTYDASQALTANSLTREGYTFSGWNTVQDGTGTSYTDQQSVSNLTAASDGTVTLYAQWTLEKSSNTTTYEGDDDGPEKTAELPFTDVKKGTKLYEAVYWAWQNGSTNGITETQFAPDSETNRSQMITFMYRAAGSPKAGEAGKYAGEIHRPAEDACPFTDIEPGSWYYDAVVWAWSVGITNGTSHTSFSPNTVCSEGMVKDFLERFNGADGSDNWSRDNNNCTRGNAVIMMYEEFK